MKRLIKKVKNFIDDLLDGPEGSLSNIIKVTLEALSTFVKLVSDRISNSIENTQSRTEEYKSDDKKIDDRGE